MAKLLVLAETDGRGILPGTLSALAFAQEYARETSGTFDLLLAGGTEVASGVSSWSAYGAERVWTATSAALLHPVADRLAAVCVSVARQAQADFVAAPATSFGRDVLPRIAGLLDIPMVTDVLRIIPGANGRQFQRPMFAGNILATVQIADHSAIFSIRTTAFDRPRRSDVESIIEAFHFDDAGLPQGSVWVCLEAAEQKRPDLTTARVVVSGGRPLRDSETFERVLGGLADALGGAVGATRAAVDSGVAPNELQIGQTGKVVAPELYIAAGVSGSIQHLAGMKDSKIIVAINTDADAPIFSVADYGLVADLHQAVPELTGKLR